jgi:hypothetical protein
MAPPIRYPISFGAFKALLTVMGLWQSNSHVDVDPQLIKAKMGWAFRSSIPRAAITSVHAYEGIPGGIGVHGIAGRWLVNGAASGIVTLDIEPSARAFVMGFPVKLKRLSVSLEEPERFIAEISAQIS